MRVGCFFCHFCKETNDCEIIGGCYGFFFILVHWFYANVILPEEQQSVGSGEMHCIQISSNWMEIEPFNAIEIYCYFYEIKKNLVIWAFFPFPVNFFVLHFFSHNIFVLNFQIIRKTWKNEKIWEIYHLLKRLFVGFVASGKNEIPSCNTIVRFQKWESFQWSSIALFVFQFPSE